MKFADFFHQLREQYLTTDVRNMNDRLAIQINLIGTEEETGTFYVEIKDGHLAIEPYDYYDRDASITISMSDFQQVLSHKLDPDVYKRQGIRSGCRRQRLAYPPVL